MSSNMMAVSEKWRSIMNISKVQNGSELCISLEGRLDTTTSPQLEAEIKQSMDNVDSLIFDLGKLEYVSSAGLRVLLLAQRTMNKKQGNLVLKNVSEAVKEVLDLTGFSSIMKIQ